tara:strand:+ start:15905 stop:16591 length:687 start_codon:yes stop_codon:yes gene_type:complete
LISKHKPSGIYLINKPISWSSFDVVKKIRSFLRKKYNIKKIKVGHCGTLDPLASGLLIVFVGDKTKIISQYQNLDKEYIGTIKLGSVTDSFDRETKEKNHKPYSNLSIGSIKEVIESFLGQQDQMPPIFSAVKINGERLYKHARNGNYNIHLEPRIIKIHKISILSIDLPFLQILIRCSKGTYIRSLAHDIGKKLGCGAYLFNLKRSKIGQHNLVDACTLEEFINNYS